MDSKLRQIIPKPSTTAPGREQSNQDPEQSNPPSSGRRKAKIKANQSVISSDHESISAELKSENKRLLKKVKDLEERLTQSEDRNTERANSLARASDTINCFGNASFPDAAHTIEYGSEYHEHQLHNYSLPLYLAQPITTPSMEPLGQAFNAFWSHAKEEMVDGESLEDTINQPDVDISAALGYKDPEETSPLSKWAYDMVKASKIKGQQTELGIMHCFFKFMRWQTHPTPETYADIPPIIRPTASQLLVPHPIWIDYVLWPAMRELFIAKPELYNGTLDWLTPYETVHVKGSFSPRDIYDMDPKQNYINVKQSFKDYVSKPSNWPVGQALIDVLPELNGKMVVEEPPNDSAMDTKWDS